MPQATDELRARWGGDDGIGDDKAIRHLLRKGFRFPDGIAYGLITPPVGGYDWDADTEDTWGAVEFLCDEWDYGYNPDAIDP